MVADGAPALARSTSSSSPVNGAVVGFPHRRPASPLPVALDPAQAAIAAEILGARLAIPIHAEGYEIDGVYQPVPDAAERFAEAAAARDVPVRILDAGGVDRDRCCGEPDEPVDASEHQDAGGRRDPTGPMSRQYACAQTADCAASQPQQTARLRPRSGASRDRTGDLLLAKQALSQLSYGPAAAECSDGASDPAGVLDGRQAPLELGHAAGEVALGRAVDELPHDEAEVVDRLQAADPSPDAGAPRSSERGARTCVLALRDERRPCTGGSPTTGEGCVPPVVGPGGAPLKAVGEPLDDQTSRVPVLTTTTSPPTRIRSCSTAVCSRLGRPIATPWSIVARSAPVRAWR